MPQEKYILVVDDEPNIREFVRHSLEKHAFKVKLATNGWDALAEFEQTTFVLVILDIMMPQMNGLEACRRIRQTSIVFTSLLNRCHTPQCSHTRKSFSCRNDIC